jgi:hypothetical protein
MAMRGLLAVGCIVLITEAAGWAGYEPLLVRGVFIYSCTFLLAAVKVPLYTVLSGNERLDYATAIDTIGHLLFMAVGGAFLLSGLS